MKRKRFKSKNVMKAGNTQPKLNSPKKIKLFISIAKFFKFGINTKKSGILNIKVTKITPLKTNFDANISGTTFSKIKTMVIGYTNNPYSSCKTC